MLSSRLLQSLLVSALAVSASLSPASASCSLSFGKGGSTIRDGDVVTATVKFNPAQQQQGKTPTQNQTPATPGQPCKVEVSAPGLTFGRKVFTFDPQDPSTHEQSVTCRTDAGSAPGKNGATIPVTVTFKPQSGQTPTTQVVQRQVVTAGKCSGWGDPHLSTLDGVAFDFQKAGVFRLFESRNFQVQVFQEKCAPTIKQGERSPSCYQGVSVAFAGSVVRFFLQNGQIVVGKGTSGLQWLLVEKLKAGEGYRVFTAVDHATYVDVTKGVWTNNYAYLNVALQVSAYFKDASVNGLMGNWNEDKKDDVVDNDKLATTYGSPLTDNLFTCLNDGCGRFMRGPELKDDLARGLPNTMELLHQGFVPVEDHTIQLRAFEPKLPPLPKRRVLQADDPAALAVQADAAARAPQLCAAAINSVPLCHKYVANRGFFISTVCVPDASLVGDLAVAENTKLSYLRECRRELDSRIEANTTGSAGTLELLSDRLALKFGDLSTCERDCNGRGECLAAGCHCNAGFTGYACEIQY
ncbi:hypothetical protein ATCC90586_008151 [Pythium insidiosum]|nr:hypothetical protein ATCC90586_008151 [Pythium insidiosum]